MSLLGRGEKPIGQAATHGHGSEYKIYEIFNIFIWFHSKASLGPLVDRQPIYRCSLLIIQFYSRERMNKTHVIVFLKNQLIFQKKRTFFEMITKIKKFNNTLNCIIFSTF